MMAPVTLAGSAPFVHVLPVILLVIVLSVHEGGTMHYQAVQGSLALLLALVSSYRSLVSIPPHFSDLVDGVSSIYAPLNCFPSRYVSVCPVCVQRPFLHMFSSTPHASLF